MTKHLDVTASPGSSIVAGCTCRAVLIDYVTRKVTHPYFACVHHGTTSTLDPHPAWDIS